MVKEVVQGHNGTEAVPGMGLGSQWSLGHADEGQHGAYPHLLHCLPVSLNNFFPK